MTINDLFNNPSEYVAWIFKKVAIALRIAIIPPYRIADIDGHVSVNIGSFLCVTALYFGLRQFTPPGLDDIEPAALVAILVIVLFCLSGLVISVFDRAPAGGKKANIANKWTTFLIISFFWVLILLLGTIVGVPALSRFVGYEITPARFFIDHMHYKMGTAFLSLGAALGATAILALKARRILGADRSETMVLKVGIFTFCAMLNFVVAYLLVFLV